MVKKNLKGYEATYKTTKIFQGRKIEFTDYGVGKPSKSKQLDHGLRAYLIKKKPASVKKSWLTGGYVRSK